MKEIPLTQGQVALVDDEDYERVTQFKWHAYYNKGVRGFYALHNLRIGCRHTTIYMHRFITNAQPNEKVDHWNHNTLDNQKHNIRRCTDLQSVANRRSYVNTSSPYKGVWWDRKHKKWAVQITRNRKTLSLGYFTDPKKAALAYDAKAKELFGEFAYLNSPEVATWT